MDFDELMDKIGGFGPLQRIYFVVISLADMFGAFGIMITVFIGGTPRWRCSRFEDKDFFYDGNNTFANSVNHTINDTLLKCDNMGRKCVEFDYIDDYTSVVSQFDLVCGSSFVIGTVRTIQMLGVWLGAVVASQLSDMIGRKKTLCSIFLIEIVGGVASSFSPNWQIYAACRFLVGAGFGGVASVGCVYPIEFVGRRWRTLVGTIGFWAVGVMLLALLGFFIRDWRHLVMATTLSSVPLFISFIFLPESPRWLLQKGRNAEAEQILSHLAARNGRELPEGFSKLVSCAEGVSGTKKTRVYSYLDLFKRRKTTTTTLVMVAVWFDIVISYYIMTYNMGNLAGNRYMNMFLMGITEYPAMACTFFLGNWIGRRYTYLIYSIVTMACCATVIASHFNSVLSSSPVLTTIMSQVARACVSGGMSTLMFYTPELFPTVIRNVGLGAALFSGRLAGMIAPQIVFLGRYGRLIPYIVVLVLTATLSPLLFILPETNGKPIQDALPQRRKGRIDDASLQTPDVLLEARDSDTECTQNI